MAKNGTVPGIVLDGLRDDYLTMQDKCSKVARDVKERYRKKIQDEIEAETRLIKRAFAVKFVEVREQGATRDELTNVIGDRTAKVFREYVELGGGSISRRTTAEDRKAERMKELGVTDNGDGTFNLSVGEGEYLAITVEWQEGRPYIWPVEQSDVVILRDTYGYTQSAMFEKGAEIVASFGLGEE